MDLRFKWLKVSRA